MENCNQTLHDRGIKCKNSRHSDQNITYVCLEKNCQFDSRFLCLNCIIEEHNSHSQQSLNIKDIETKQAQNVANWPLNKKELGRFPQILEQEISSTNIIQQIKDFFKDFKLNLEEQINTYEKEIIVKANTILKNSLDLEKEIKKTISLDKLKDILKNYSNDYIDHQTAMQQIGDFANNLNFQPQSHNFMYKYGINMTENLKNVKEQLEQQSKQIYQFIKQNLKPLLLSPSNSQNNINQFKFQQAQVDKSDELIQIIQRKIIFVDNNQSSNNSSRLVVYSDKFTRNQHIKLKFKITYGYNSRGYKYGQKVNMQNYRILVGIVVDQDQHNGCNWANSGNQIDIGSRLESKNPVIINKSVKSFAHIMEKNQQLDLEIEINVENSIFKIKDEQGQITVENKEIFENSENWRFIISNHTYYTPVFELVGYECV